MAQALILDRLPFAAIQGYSLIHFLARAEIRLSIRGLLQLGQQSCFKERIVLSYRTLGKYGLQSSSLICLTCLFGLMSH
jgi:hypothetical protein